MVVSHDSLRRTALLGLALLAAGCSFRGDPPSGKVRCGADGSCPAGQRCVAAPEGPPGVMVCCIDATCGRPGGPPADGGGSGGAGGSTDGPSAPDAGPGPRDGAAGAAGEDAVRGDALVGVGDGAPGDRSSPGDALAGDRAMPPVDARPADAPGTSPALARGLLLYLRLDDGPGSFDARDSSSAGQRVALRDLNPATAWAADGRIGRAIALGSGSNGGGWLRVESSTTLNTIESGFTIAAWVRRRGNGALVSRRAGGPGGFHYSVDITAGKLRVRLNSANGYRADVSSLEPVPEGQWTHLAASYDLKAARLYIDGRPVGSQPYEHPLGPDNTPLVIGGAQETPSEAVSSRLDAVIDEVAVHGRALAPDEVALLAAGVQPATDP